MHLPKEEEEEEEYLRFMSECRGANLAREPFHVWG